MSGSSDYDSEQTPDLVRFKVSGLLGQFDHEVIFPKEWPFCILFGPNGVGKTQVLHLIRAILELDHPKILNSPFDYAEVDFDDETQMCVTRSKTTLDLKFVEPEEEGQADLYYLQLCFKSPNAEDINWEYSESDFRGYEFDNEFVSSIAKRPGMRGISPSLIQEAIEKFHLDIPPGKSNLESRLRHEIERYYRLRVGRPAARHGTGYRNRLTSGEVNVTRLAKRNTVKIIAAQRLLLDETEEELLESTRRGRTEVNGLQRSAVTELARDLSSRLHNAMADNARVSQMLDRDFPASLLQGHESLKNITEEEIRERYASQTELRKNLSDIAVLDANPDIPLPPRALEEWERMVLSKYLDDTERKLSTYGKLLSQVTLLRDIINARFLFKTMHVDRDQGFLFTGKSGQRIRAQQLSSGEQHQLVLMYTMLFRVKYGSLVLIDEPEISLHIAWQQKFLSDMADIARVSGLRFIVATHSPQLIHHWWDYAVSLEPGEE